MALRPRSEPLSPRAAARLRTPRRGSRDDRPRAAVPPVGPAGDQVDDDRAWVPTAADLRGERSHEGGASRGSDVHAWSVGADGRLGGASADEGFGGGERRGFRSWFRAPAAFVGARWEPGRLALLGVALVVVAAAVVFGLRVAWASGEGTVLAPGGGSRAGPSGLSAGSEPVGAGPSATVGAGVSPSPGASASAGAVVVVHVVGQVRRPGVQRLPPGSRVADALAAAGGATKGADLARVNLARVLVDGEQVVVPAPGDPDPPGAPNGGATGGSGSPPGGSDLVPINTADLAELDTLPGVGPVLAQRILDWRAEHGRFTAVDELGEVSGIGEKLLERLRPLVTL